MNYKEKYQELQNNLEASNILEKYKCDDYFAMCIIIMRSIGLTYTNIQKQLGMPSKKAIRQALLQYAPDLIDNSTPKVKKYSDSYSQLYGLLCKTDKKEWDIWGDLMDCYIKDHIIYFNGDPLSIWSEVEQKQVLEAIKSQI